MCSVVRVIVFGLALTLLGLGFVVIDTHSTLAQSATTVPNVVATPPPSTVPGNPGALSGENVSGSAKGWLVGGLLGLALLTVLMHYYFLGQSRSDYFVTIKDWAKQGVFAQPVLVRAQGEVARARLGQEADEVPPTLTLVGPPSIIGNQPTVYVAMINGAPAPQVTWSIDPATAATATPAMGSITLITPVGPGQFTVTASNADPAVKTTPLAVTASDPVSTSAPAGPPLPFIGQGFASLVGAIILIAAVVVLAAIGVQDWQVIGTIFGSLAGYFFGTIVSSSK